MLKVLRLHHSVIVVDEDESRGIAFPTHESTQVKQFVAEVQEQSTKIKEGTVLVILVFDPTYKSNYHPMDMFLKGRNANVLNDDKVAKELYKFYFDNAIPQISPRSVDYIFIG